ncbi:fatty acid desaturase [Pararhodobacter sp. SW119]|uniref:fatty acid desaturase n=1 Tax=Pararhodobacter sp. SW119 TaxID=2780075 RepID=UPI001AE04184|nr:fatty acid desaturase [Pararhodobacter sp. SW119]
MQQQIDHRDWLAALPPAQRADLARRSDAAGLRRLAAHLGLILLCGGLIAAQLPGWWLLLPVQGVLLVFLFTLAHEATHRTPFASDGLNSAAGHVAGLVLVLPFQYFRYLHFAHHRWTNIPGRDPELAQPRPRTAAEWALHVSGLPYWWAGLRLMARLVAGRADDDFLPAAARPRVVAEARAMALVYVLLALSLIWSPLIVWVWLVPVLLGQPVLRLYLLAEHGDCPHVADMFLNTRTTFTSRAVRFLAWNMPYHTEHHVAPTVPFHRLPDLHLLMRDRLGVTAAGYAAFNRAYLARRWPGRAAAGTDPD